MAGHWTARRCFALKKNGELCLGRALENGRCKYHSGMVTPYRTRPISEAGKVRIGAAAKAMWGRAQASAFAKGFVAIANASRETRQSGPLPEGARMAAGRLPVKLSTGHTPIAGRKSGRMDSYALAAICKTYKFHKKSPNRVNQALLVCECHLRKSGRFQPVIHAPIISSRRSPRPVQVAMVTMQPGVPRV
jgi:hypothetical protein